MMNTSVRKPRADPSVIEYPHPKKNQFFRQLAMLPFETAIALASVWGGVASSLGLTAGQGFSATLPPLMVSAFNLLYILSGLAIVLGIGWGYRNLEACGLVLLTMSLLVRGIAVVVTAGATTPVLTAQFSTVVFIGATVLRFRALVQRAVIAQINGRVTTIE
jgi:hypothetical protein